MRLAKATFGVAMALVAGLSVRFAPAQSNSKANGAASASAAAPEAVRVVSKPGASSERSESRRPSAEPTSKAAAAPKPSGVTERNTAGSSASAATPKPTVAPESNSTRKPSRTKSAGKPSATRPGKSGAKQGGSAPGGEASSDSRKSGKDGVGSDGTQTDPELAALENAEKALFPWALRGVRSGFSFDEVWRGRGSSSAEPVIASPAWVKQLSLPAVFPNVDGRILTYLEFYRSSPDGKSILRTWAKKRGRFQGAISATLAKSGVPTELVWQSLVESGHNPTIKSPAGAAGLWQFMPETARLYGLVVDRWQDERLDPERSTVAAAKMMADLFQRFGNWELALAAFNMGDAGLLRAIRKYNTNDFWALSRYEAGLPMETALYVPRIIALTIAMQNPRAFGIEDVVPDEAVDFDTVTVASGQLLSSIARVLGISEEELVRYNPQLLLQRTPPALASDKAWARVYVPRGTAELVRGRIGRLTGLEPDLVAYTAKPGETFEWLANARGIPVQTLRNLNRASNDERIEAGTVVLLPRQPVESIEPKSTDEDRIAVVPPNVDVPPSQRRIFYRVRGTDTLSSIADAFGIRRVDLLSTNCIDTSARLQPRMLLQLIVPSNAQFENRSYVEEKEVTLLVAGSPEFGEYYEGLRGNERIVVQAKENDNLASIGAKFGVSVGTMERINRRSRRDVLVPGDSIIVYAKRKGAQERVTASR